MVGAVDVDEKSRTERIRELNDSLRTTFEGGKVLVTRGVDASPYKDQIVEAVRTYDFSKADPGDDPYGERDFGMIEIKSERFYWKVDYYDANYEYHSPDETDPKVTRRVLTIMRADEY